jgi:hypothetical protein
MNRFREAMIKAGLTNEFLLERTEELIDAIESGKFKPRNKTKVLKELLNTKEGLIYRIKNNIE